MKTIFFSGIVLMIFFISMAAAASATRIGPITVDGFQHCADIGYPEASLIVAGPNSGTFTNPDGFKAEITLTSPQNIDWTSNFIVNAALVHNSEVNVYTYNPGQTSDTGLTAPPNNGNQYHVNHIELCYTAAPIPVPEFPSLALQAAFIVGLVGTVLFVKSTGELTFFQSFKYRLAITRQKFWCTFHVLRIPSTCLSCL